MFSSFTPSAKVSFMPSHTFPGWQERIACIWQKPVCRTKTVLAVLLSFLLWSLCCISLLVCMHRALKQLLQNQIPQFLKILPPLKIHALPQISANSSYRDQHACAYAASIMICTCNARAHMYDHCIVAKFLRREDAREKF